MHKTIQQIPKATKHIFLETTWLSVFVVLSLAMFALMFYIPILSIPGNSIRFQIELFGYKDFLFLILLSALSALVVTMNLKILSSRFSKRAFGGTMLGGVGVLSGLASSLFATATCGMCVLSLFSFLGAGFVFTLVDNRSYIVLGTTAFLILSLYFSSKRLNNHCEICK